MLMFLLSYLTILKVQSTPKYFPDTAPAPVRQQKRQQDRCIKSRVKSTVIQCKLLQKQDWLIVKNKEKFTTQYLLANISKSSN